MLLLRNIERYLRHHNIAPTTFGRAAAGDPRLLHDMRNGREIGRKLTRRITEYMTQSDRETGQ